MKQKHFEALDKSGACEEATQWLLANRRKSVETLWNTCPRGDWMLWLLHELDYRDDRVWRLMAVAFVRETPLCDANGVPLADGRKVFDLLTDERSRQALIVAEQYANGEADDRALNAARDAAWSAARGVQSAVIRRFVSWQDVEALIQARLMPVTA